MDVGGVTTRATEALRVIFGVIDQFNDSEYCGSQPEGNDKLKRAVSDTCNADRRNH